VISYNGCNIDFQRSGDGPVVLFVPGSFSTPAAWRPVIKQLPQCYTFVSTSLCGYGETEETRTDGDHGIAHQVRVIEAVAREAGGPVHLVGHSFGGTVAFATALDGSVEVSSIATFEANPLIVLRDRARDDLLDATREMSADYAAALRDNEPHAPRRIIDFWGGEGSYAAMPGAVQQYCNETASANVLDWQTDLGFEARRADYARLDIPALLVRGARAIPAMVEMTEGLAESIGDVRSEQVAGAGHFLITTHAEECAGLLAGFLDGVAQ